MSDLDLCLTSALEKTKKQAALLEAQHRLLENISYELTTLRSEQKKPCAAIHQEWLLTAEELFVLFNIHPLRRTEFEKKMEEWKCHSYFIGSHRYFSLLKLLASDHVLFDIAPLTLYALPSFEKGNVC